MGWLTCLICTVVPIYALVVVVMSGIQMRKSKELDYSDALNRLRDNPTDPDARSDALNIGRELRSVTGTEFGIAAHDELAIRNDIDAVTGAAVRPVGTPNQSPAERLETLEELKRRGLISDDEYAAQRAKIISEL